MLFLLCTAGVEIMRHSSVAARAPQQTHTVCIRYLRFCKGIGERCTQPDANFDRGETVMISRLDTCVAGVVFTGVPVFNSDTASSSGPAWSTCLSFVSVVEQGRPGIWGIWTEKSDRR